METGRKEMLDGKIRVGPLVSCVRSGEDRFLFEKSPPLGGVVGLFLRLG